MDDEHGCIGFGLQVSYMSVEGGHIAGIVLVALEVPGECIDDD